MALGEANGRLVALGAYSGLPSQLFSQPWATLFSTAAKKRAIREGLGTRLTKWHMEKDSVLSRRRVPS